MISYFSIDIIFSMKKIMIVGFCTKDTINKKTFFGGAAGGIALNLAKFNIPVGILSILGTDLFSKKYLNALIKKNIDISNIFFYTNPIPEMVVLEDNGKELGRKFDDHGNSIYFEDINPDKKSINQFDFAHIVNTNKKLVDYLAENFKGEISYCPGSLLVRDKNSLSIDLLKKTNYLFVNSEEHDILKKIIKLDELFLKNLKMLCITKGMRGVNLITKSNSIFLKAKKVKVRDTTGAGDAVVVGFIKGLYENNNYEDSVKMGMKLASDVIQKLGGQL